MEWKKWRLINRLQRDPPYTTFDNSSFSIHSGAIGGVQVKGVLRVATNEKGMYLKVLLPFKFGHSDLMIPWYDITSISSEPDSRRTEFTFRHYPDQTFYLEKFKGLKDVPAELLK